MLKQKKAEILYKSSKRGCREMDLLFGAFVKDIIETLDNKELLELEEFCLTDDLLLQDIANLKTLPETKMSKQFLEHCIKKTRTYSGLSGNPATIERKDSSKFESATFS